MCYSNSDSETERSNWELQGASSIQQQDWKKYDPPWSTELRVRF
jgi:hypothetical protein